MKQLDEDQLYAVCLPHLQKAGYASENPDEKEAAWLKAICAAMREHVQYGAQMRRRCQGLLHRRLCAGK